MTCPNLISVTGFRGVPGPRGPAGAIIGTDYPIGAVGDGIADDTQAIQDALDRGERDIYVPKGKYRITAPLSVPSGVTLRGSGWDLRWTYKDVFEGVTGDPLAGTVIIPDFAATGNPPTNWTIFLGRGARLKDLALVYDRQVAIPTDGSEFEPIVSPWAIQSGTGDDALDVRELNSGGSNLLIIGFSHGIRLLNGSEDGLWERIHLHAFSQSLYADGNYNTLTLRGWHVWPYYSTAEVVQIYTRDHLTAFSFGRVDALFMTDCLSINTKLALKLFDGNLTPPGLMNNFKINSCYFDGTMKGLEVDAPANPNYTTGGVFMNSLFQKFTSSYTFPTTEWIEPVGHRPEFIEIKGKPSGLRFDGCTFSASGIRIWDVDHPEESGVPALRVNDVIEGSWMGLYVTGRVVVDNCKFARWDFWANQGLETPCRDPYPAFKSYWPTGTFQIGQNYYSENILSSLSTPLPFYEGVFVNDVEDDNNFITSGTSRIAPPLQDYITVSGSISSTTLTVSTSLAQKNLAAGMAVSGVGVSAGTVIAEELTNPQGGSAGTYRVTPSQNVSTTLLTVNSPKGLAFIRADDTYKKISTTSSFSPMTSGARQFRFVVRLLGNETAACVQTFTIGFSGNASIVYAFEDIDTTANITLTSPWITIPNADNVDPPLGYLQAKATQDAILGVATPSLEISSAELLLR